MKSYGIEIAEGTKITNVVIDSGSVLPTLPDEGELFLLDGQLLYYTGGVWKDASKELPVGGAIGSVISKSSLVDYDVEWKLLTAGDVGADPSGTASTEVTNHINLSDPHVQYLLESEAATTYAAINHAHSTNNLIIVKKNPGPGEYSSVVDAINFVNTQSPSSSNRFVIQMNPGEYIESPFTIPGYVYVVGHDPWNSATIRTNDDAVDFITVAPNGGMFQVAVYGPANTGTAAIVQVSSGTTKLYWVNIKHCKIGVKLAPTSGAARCHCIGVVTDAFGAGTVERMFSADNPVGAGIFILMMSGPMSASISGGYGVYLDGPTANATLDLCQFRGTGSTCLYVNGGASARGISCSFAQGATAIDIGPSGASRVDIHGSQIKPGLFTTDINIQSPTAIVTYSGVATEAKILNPLNASLTINVSDADKGQVIFGELLIGSKAVQTPLTSYIQADKNTGLISGGSLVRGAGTREVDVAAGSGFVDLSNGLKKILWSATTITVPASSSGYIIVDQNNVVQFSTVDANVDSLALGRVNSDASDITTLGDRSIILPQFRRKMFDYLGQVIGPINVSGGVVTATGLAINATDSLFYITEDENLSTGGSAVTFRYWHRDGSGGWVVTSGETAINPNQYDDGSGTLASVPAGKFKRDSLFVGTNGDNAVTDYHVVYGQELFDSDGAALVNPIAPSELLVSSCRLAGVIVEQGAASVSSIADDRPRLGQAAAASSGVTNHNDLTGRDSLTAHTQYQLLSGKNAANGYLGLNASVQIDSAYFPLSNLPPQNVTKATATAGTSGEMARVDHKHDISTAAPSSIGTANSEGNATTLARSNHVHNHGTQTSGTHHAVATITVNGFMSATDKVKLDGVASNANNYVLPVATTLILGGVKQGAGITIAGDGTISRDALVAGDIPNIDWSKITSGTPTTLAGYGITDAAPASRTISTTAPLSGGGDLSANRTLSIVTNGISNSLIRQSVGTSIIGRSVGTTGNVADIVASADGQVLQQTGGALSFAQLSHTVLSNVGTNTHAQIDTFIASKAAANGLASLGSQTTVPVAQLGTGTPTATTYLRGDGLWLNAVSSINIIQPASGITTSGGPITTSGNITLGLANDLAAIEALSSSGFAVRTATDTWAIRTLIAPATGLTISNPAGTAGSPTFALANDLAAVEGLTGTGIVRRTATDTWSAGTAVNLASEVTGTLPIANGGTGASTATAAITALLPTQVGQTGKVLQSNGTVASWATIEGGKLVQQVDHTVVAASGTTIMPTTTPAISDGTQIASVQITPTSASNLVNIDATIQGGTNANGGMAIAIWRTVGAVNTLIGGIVIEGHNHNSNQRVQGPLSVIIHDTPNTTAIVTYTFRVGRFDATSGTWYIAQVVQGNWGGVFSASSNIILTESTL